jgi:hypothetical protein
MNRLIELSIFLVAIISLAIITASVKTHEHYADGASPNIDAISRDMADSGLRHLSSCPSSAIKSFIKLVPNLDDLLSGAYLKEDYARGLAGMNSITARTCNDGKGTKLMSSVDSNKAYCTLMMDLQKYSFMSTSINLAVSVAKSTDNSISVYPNQELINFLLLRPAYIVIENSTPFILDLNRTTPFTYSTSAVPTVQGLKSFGSSTLFSLPVAPISRQGAKMFPATTQTSITKIIAQKVKDVSSAATVANKLVQLNMSVFYLDRDYNFANKVKLEDNNSSINVATSEYINSVFNKYRVPQSKGVISANDMLNPVVSITFRVFGRRPTNSTDKPFWMGKWAPLLSVAASDGGACDSASRSVCYVEVRPELYRTDKSYGNTLVEDKPSSNQLMCIDFTNTERDINSSRIVDSCGQMRNVVWIPTGTDVDIAYIIGPSFKLVVASYYQNKRRSMTFQHLYQCDSRVNDIVSGIKGGTLNVNNLCLKNNTDPNALRVSKVEMTYGMMNLQKWYTKLTNAS